MPWLNFKGEKEGMADPWSQLVIAQISPSQSVSGYQLLLVSTSRPIKNQPLHKKILHAPSMLFCQVILNCHTSMFDHTTACPPPAVEQYTDHICR